MVSKWWHCSVLYRILIHVHVRFLPNCTQYAAKYAPALKMFTKNIISLSHIVCRLVIVSHCEYWEYLSLESKEKWKIDQLWHYLTFFFSTYCILKWITCNGGLRKKLEVVFFFGWQLLTSHPGPMWLHCYSNYKVINHDNPSNYASMGSLSTDV